MPISATADCPSGKKALGGGHLITAVEPYCTVGLMASYPSDDDTWTATGVEGSMAMCAMGWSIRAYVICATVN